MRQLYISMEEPLCYVKLKAHAEQHIWYSMFFTHVMTYINMLVVHRLSPEEYISKWVTVVVSEEKEQMAKSRALGELPLCTFAAF